MTLERLKFVAADARHILELFPPYSITTKDFMRKLSSRNPPLEGEATVMYALLQNFEKLISTPVQGLRKTAGIIGVDRACKVPILVEAILVHDLEALCDDAPEDSEAPVSVLDEDPTMAILRRKGLL